MTPVLLMRADIQHINTMQLVKIWEIMNTGIYSLNLYVENLNDTPMANVVTGKANHGSRINQCKRASTAFCVRVLFTALNLQINYLRINFENIIILFET